MKQKQTKNNRHLLFIFQIVVSPILLVLLLIGSIGVIYINDRDYSYRLQDEIHTNISASLNNTFKSINSSIATFFANESFQEIATEFLEGEDVYQEMSANLKFFINSNAMFSPGLIYVPIDQISLTTPREASITIDLDHSYRDFNYDSLLNAANGYMGERSGTIFYQDIEYFLTTSSPETQYFALGKNVISVLTNSSRFYERIGIVFVILHKSLIINYLKQANQIDGLSAFITNKGNIAFKSNAIINNDLINNIQKYRQRTSLLTMRDWTLYVVFNKSQVFTNISQTIYIMSALLIVALIGFFFIILHTHHKHQASLLYLFNSFSRIQEQETNSLLITRTGEKDVDTVIDSYNDMVQDVIFLKEKVNAEQHKSLILRNENIDYSLNVLYSQINKHFIINVLSIIRSLVTIGQYDKVSPVIESFSEFLRYSLTIGRYSTFYEELKNAEDYLKIQTIRYPMFKSKFNIDNKLDNVILPRVVIQPILENCFVHGMKDVQFNIDINTYQDDEFAVIEVINDSVDDLDKERINFINQKLQDIEKTEKRDIKISKNGNHNVALINILRRLKLDNDDARMTITILTNGRTRVALYIPYIRKEDYA